MGLVDKLNQLMNPDSVEDYDDGDYMFDDGADQGYAQDYQQTGYAQPQPQQGFSSSALELKVVKPERFEDASSIADHLLSRRTIVLNLEDTNSEVSRRLIDFLSGVAYSIDGNLKKVADHTFVITPNNVVLSAERMSAPQQKADTFGGF
ncbi:MAG: cell division protein SepF [Clostridia bacterium]|nr:cell division protein SepF [Clostridia bacterium]